MSDTQFTITCETVAPNEGRNLKGRYARHWCYEGEGAKSAYRIG